MTRRRLIRHSICWHTSLTWLPKVKRQLYVTPRNVGKRVLLGATPLMVILGRHSDLALSNLIKATSHFCSIEGQARLLAPAYYLVDFGLNSQGKVFFLELDASNAVSKPSRRPLHKTLRNSDIKHLLEQTGSPDSVVCFWIFESTMIKNMCLYFNEIYRKLSIEWQEKYTM